MRIFLLLFLFCSSIYGQSIVDEIDQEASDTIAPPTLNTEKIDKISASKKIFILTNSNSSYGKGDFITFVLDNELVARALVAKTNEGMGGVKIMKVYSQDLWKTLRAGSEVQIIRGDDSYFRNLKKKKDKKEDGFKIQDDDDLFNETTLLEDDLSVDEKNQRLIKQDNIISVLLGRIEGQDLSGQSTRYNQINAAWAYQIDDNIWGELSYGQNVINDYPQTGLDTKLTNITIKGKYTISAPFYSYVQPYIGYQILSADSPGAGEPDSSGSSNSDDLEKEKQLVADLEKNTVIFGVSVLKRLVPGWFARLDLGSDIISFGFALEF